MVGKNRDTITYTKVTIGCFVLLVCSVLFYLYFLNMSVVEVVVRGSHIEQQQVLGGQIATLEAEYIDAQHTIAERIAMLGNQALDNPKYFVSRSQASLVFGAN